MLDAETDFDRRLARVIRYYKNEVHKVQLLPQNRAISEEEHVQLISHWSPTHKTRLKLEILWESGMRCEEAHWLQFENFNEDMTECAYKINKPSRKTMPDGTVVKFYKSRRVKFSQDLATRLCRYRNGIKRISPYGFLFPSFEPQRMLEGKFYENQKGLNQEITKWREQMGGRWIKKIPHGDGETYLLAPHGYRRAWITRRVMKTKNVALVAREINHNDPSVTYDYFQLAQEEDSRVEAMEGARIPAQETELQALRDEISQLRRLILERQSPPEV